MVLCGRSNSSPTDSLVTSGRPCAWHQVAKAASAVQQTGSTFLSNSKHTEQKQKTPSARGQGCLFMIFFLVSDEYIPIPTPKHSPRLKTEIQQPLTAGLPDHFGTYNSWARRVYIPVPGISVQASLTLTQFSTHDGQSHNPCHQVLVQIGAVMLINQLSPW